MVVYTIPEVAKLLKTSKDKVYKLVERKELDALKLGCLKVPDFAIDDFLRRNLGKDLSDLDNIVEL